jgi:hypothetical protein
MSRVVPDIGRLPEVTAALAARAGEHDRAGSFPADGIGLRWMAVWATTDEPAPRVGSFRSDSPGSRSSPPGITWGCGPAGATT